MNGWLILFIACYVYLTVHWIVLLVLTSLQRKRIAQLEEAVEALTPKPSNWRFQQKLSDEELES